MPFVNMPQIRPLWLRLLFLLALGLPGFTGWPTGRLTTQLAGCTAFTPELAHMIVWTGYACLVWLVVLARVGGNRFLGYMSAAFIFGLTVAVLGTLMRRIFPILAGGMPAEAVSFKLLRILLNILIFLPYSIYFINSFSAKNLVDRVARMRGRYRTLGLHLALAFRVLQHTGEVIFNLFDIWKETHPDLILPRHRKTWQAGRRLPAQVIRWIWQAIHAWIFACIVHTFEPIPSMVDDIEKIDRAQTRGVS